MGQKDTNDGYNAKDDKCLCCGQCCYIIGTDDKGRQFPTDIPCQYLKNNLCAVYAERLNKDCGHGNRCREVSRRAFDYENCPYNTGKPLVINHKLYDKRVE